MAIGFFAIASQGNLYKDLGPNQEGEIMGTRPDPEEVALRLQLLRLALGHNRQSAMVAFLDGPVSAQHWNNWERARNVPTTAQARHIATKTRVTVDWIYWGERGGLPLNMVELLDRADRKINRS